MVREIAGTVVLMHSFTRMSYFELASTQSTLAQSSPSGELLAFRKGVVEALIVGRSLRDWSHEGMSMIQTDSQSARAVCHLRRPRCMKGLELRVLTTQDSTQTNGHVAQDQHA